MSSTVTAFPLLEFGWTLIVASAEETEEAKHAVMQSPQLLFSEEKICTLNIHEKQTAAAHKCLHQRRRKNV